ncbi:MAG: hypothetical protein JXB10_07340 [Pirellulales bacterium]|nr:hypothetical protein [Pirellulales bacterium]
MSAALLRPGQWTVFGYRFVPLLLFAAGICGIIYGALYHLIPVVEKRVEKYTVEVIDDQQPPPPPPDWGPPGFGPGWESGAPPIPPPPKMKTEDRERQKEILTQESELTVNRAVTVDGIQRSPTGQLVWANQAAVASATGSGGEGGKKGPAACPT